MLRACRRPRAPGPPHPQPPAVSGLPAYPADLSHQQLRGLVSGPVALPRAAAGTPGRRWRDDPGRSTGAVPVLLYHSVSDHSDRQFGPYTVSPAQFAAHLDRCWSSASPPITVGELSPHGAGRGSAARAHRGDHLRRRLRRLRRQRLARADRARSGGHPVRHRGRLSAAAASGWPRWGPVVPMLTPREIAELAADGCEIGAHSMTHPQLDCLPRRGRRTRRSGTARTCSNRCSAGRSTPSPIRTATTTGPPRARRRRRLPLGRRRPERPQPRRRRPLRPRPGDRHVGLRRRATSPRVLTGRGVRSAGPRESWQTSALAAGPPRLGPSVGRAAPVLGERSAMMAGDHPRPAGGVARRRRRRPPGPARARPGVGRRPLRRRPVRRRQPATTGLATAASSCCRWSRRRGLLGSGRLAAVLPASLGHGWPGRRRPGRRRARARCWPTCARTRSQRIGLRPDPPAGPALGGGGRTTSVTLTIPRRAHVIDLTGGADAAWPSCPSRPAAAPGWPRRAGVRVEIDRTGALLEDYYRLYLLSVDRWAERQHEPRALARFRARRRDPLTKLQAMSEHLGKAFVVTLAYVDDRAGLRLDHPARPDRPRHPGRHGPGAGRQDLRR